jgi:hypothetical protein
MLTRKPTKGDLIRWTHWPKDRTAVVLRTPEGDENLCWIREGELDAPFIWRFRDGLNTMVEVI